MHHCTHSLLFFLVAVVVDIFFIRIIHSYKNIVCCSFVVHPNKQYNFKSEKHAIIMRNKYVLYIYIFYIPISILHTHTHTFHVIGTVIFFSVKEKWKQFQKPGAQKAFSSKVEMLFCSLVLMRVLFIATTHNVIHTAKHTHMCVGWEREMEEQGRHLDWIWFE